MPSGAGPRQLEARLGLPGARGMDGPGSITSLPASESPARKCHCEGVSLYLAGAWSPEGPSANAGTWEGGLLLGQRILTEENPGPKSEGRGKEAKGQEWSVRGVDRKGKRPGKTEMGTEGHRKGRAQKGKLGRVIRRKTHLFLGGKKGKHSTPPN